jgi:chlorite dismutase
MSIDVREKTKAIGGKPEQVSDERLFMQLLVFDAQKGPGRKDLIALLASGLKQRGARAVIYEDVNNPYGIGLLSWSTDPEDFLAKTHPAVTESGLEGLTLLPAFTMIGRTYATGYEPDLKFWLLDRPEQTALNTSWPWAVWYPLRRSGAFEKLEPSEKGAILREHGEIGKAYGEGDLAHDIRLACHGLDTNDNEFVIGLVGKELYPLSHVVQRMRSTRQTSEYIVQMGPFFVGRTAFATKPE